MGNDRGHIDSWLRQEPRLWAIRQNWEGVYIRGERIAEIQQLISELQFHEVWIMGDTALPYVYKIASSGNQRNRAKDIRELLMRLWKPGLQFIVVVWEVPFCQSRIDRCKMSFLKPPNGGWEPLFRALHERLNEKYEYGFA